jgi:ubiquinone/menaquinone biosynthesis C-methylase UbiE
MTADLKYPRDFPWITPYNPFANFRIATDYVTQRQAACRRMDQYVKDLLKRLLKAFSSAHSILEVGCGTGHFNCWFAGQGLRAVGLDLSWPILEQARHSKSSSLLQGDAFRLPFNSASFDLLALIATLEFIPNPDQVLHEAIRVARQGLVLVVVNAQSRLGRQCNCQDDAIWEVAQLFTPTELRHLLQDVVGKKSRYLWQTTRPFWTSSSPYVWGDFIGLAVKLN